ncbi:MAG: CDP-diacylglycerol--glycerol-3-phosphate 3-phosphatidyltransferase [Oscillospiraceae bacterium]|nr:CDP-diacylglycerol--glycerol-3-phosphate 3-phosphatidyltransferase [Oscillospiraceae bacterium]
MNLPNKLTVSRILLCPFFVFFILLKDFKYNYILALIIFIIASITDAIDGKIARKRNLITNFGKLMDPLADKLLVISGFISFISLGLASSYLVIIIIARELLVTSLRLLSLEKGVVIEAGKYGKLKTIIQMVSIICIISIAALPSIGINISIDSIKIFASFFMYASTIITIFSGIDYMYKNKNIMLDL